MLALNTRLKIWKINCTNNTRINDLLPDHVSPEFVLPRMLSEKEELIREVERFDMK